MNLLSLMSFRLPAAAILLLIVVHSGIGQAQAPPKKEPPAKNPQNWAEDLLKDDPLTGKSKVTIADLQDALRDPKRRETVIERHFSRATINLAEQKQFLKAALATESAQVQRQALDQLVDLGLLEELVAEIILETAEKGDETQRHAAIIALQDFDWHAIEVPDWYRELVQKAMSSAEPSEREAATKQIVSWGVAEVPTFLKQFRSGNIQQRNQAAYALSRLLSAKRVLPGAGAPPASVPVPTGSESPPPTIAKARTMTATGPKTERKLDDQKASLVRVYFGTNRALLVDHPEPRYRLGLGISAIVIGLGIFYVRMHYRHVLHEPLRRRRAAWLTFWCLLASIGLGAWGVMTTNEAWYLYRSHRVGPEFAGSRSPEHQVYYGYCDVSIPPSHQVGLVEQPLIGGEDEEQHVVIKASTLLNDRVFFDMVRQAIAACPRQDTFIFVHGYNVTFDQAARRTAQIHYDLDFQGVPLFYSWPSRANMRLYASDRNEIGYSVEHIKQFLIDVKQRAQPGRIHIVAHSMGAEGAARAIAALGDEGRVFDQIILAAPDIDADVFREQLAPRLAKCSQRTTMYCSRNDWALHASYAFNDSPRVGDSSFGVVVRNDMDTVDASAIDTDLLGHSYYGDCLPILQDVRLMIEQNLKPDQRELERAEKPGNLIYWLFRQ